jgi:hypothetical protein
VATEENEEKEDVFKDVDDRPLVRKLFVNLKKDLPDLENLLEECNESWGYEDFTYRLYHQSYKVYDIQGYTIEIVSKLKSLLPGVDLNDYFNQIIKEGTGKKFKSEDNLNWLAATRPMVEAFFPCPLFSGNGCQLWKEVTFSTKNSSKWLGRDSLFIQLKITVKALHGLGRSHYLSTFLIFPANHSSIK